VTAANRIRRTIRGCVLLGVPLLGALAAVGSLTVAAAEPDDSPNVLDRPIADLAVLEPVGSDSTPLLVTLGALSPPSSVARIAVLRRGDAWVEASTWDIDLGAEGLDARWLVELGVGRYALVATSPGSRSGTGRAVVVGFDVTSQGDAVTIDAVDRQSFERGIVDAGAADVDGFGSAELVLGMRPLFDAGSSCGTSSLVVVDGSVSAIRRSFDLPGRLGAGVIGRFDADAGDDLLVYASEGCVPGASPESRLLTVRLADGTLSRAIPGVLQGDPARFPTPLRIDVDGSSPDEVVAVGEDGLSIFDPAARWAGMLIAGDGAVPLVAGPSSDPARDGVRVALLDPAGSGALVTARVRSDKAGGLAWSGRSEMPASGISPERWTILTTSIRAAVGRQAPSNAWLGDAVDADCPDLLLPGAILECGTDEIRSGAAWLGTHALAAMPIEGRRVVLVAAGLGWDPEIGLPSNPTPSAGGPVGWWRHGPSTPFAVSEVRSRDLVYFREFPQPVATIETQTAKDGSTVLPGFTGARLLAVVTPLAEGEVGPDPAADALAALTTTRGPGGRTSVVRVAVPPGLESGRDGSFARLTIGDVRLPDGRATGRWAMQVVPINDWGEWGQPIARTITLDAFGPTVAVEDPFTSPIWPFFARLAGRSEPGSSVRVDGIGDLEVDRRGRFTIETQLAPWPQVFRVTATDPSGNVTIGEFSIVGGVDYRRFPWPAIIAAALLALVAARGLFGSGRGRAARVEATRWSTGALDEASTPEIEELPPGSGLARG
jgi:hypothetical protein